MRWTKEQYEEYIQRLNLAKKAPKKTETGEIEEFLPDEGLEGSLQAKVIAYCKEKGWPIFHDRSRGKNEPGWPDNFIFLKNGRILLIELKSSSGKLRKKQTELRLVMGWLGYKIHVAKSFKAVLAIIDCELKKGEGDGNSENR